jgi:hypothetical protein
MTQQAQAPIPQLVRTYFVNGQQPGHWRHRFAVNTPPTAGYGHVVLLRGEKRSTLLCPYSLQSYQVPNSCGEVGLAKPVEVTNERLAALVTQGWTDAAQLGLQRDFAVAAMVLTQLGAEVPTTIEASPSSFSRVQESGEPKVQGGKPVVTENLRPVKPGSKRGEVAKFFMADKPQSLHEAMARLGLTRSGVLSHLFCLSRDHGIGYSLAGDCATLIIPEGFDLFAYVEPEKKKEKPAAEDGPPKEVKKRTSGKAINTEALAPIPQPGKRATVASLFLTWGTIAFAEKELELNRSAILSHLFTINKENGLGYELSEDGIKARLLIPEGHEVFCAKQPRAKKEAA